MSVALESKGLTKVFKAGFIPRPVVALKDVSFSIPEGKVTGFLGPNGSGKSTFLKVATELISPTEGEVTFFGGKKFKDIKHQIGFVPEKPSYPTFFSGKEILNFHGRFSKETQGRLDEVVRLVDLSHAISRPVGTYSKGMLQRLAIAQALLHKPRLLVLDEPLSGLDPDGREVLINVIKDYSDEPGRTVFLSSHLLEDLQRICNELVIIHEGRLLFSGDPSDVFDPNMFKVSYRHEGQIVRDNISKEELASNLNVILNKGGELHSVVPESEAISSLYFKLIQEDSAGEKLNGQPT